MKEAVKLARKIVGLQRRQGILSYNSSLMKSEDLHFFEVRTIFYSTTYMYYHLELEYIHILCSRLPLNIAVLINLIT